MSTPFQKAKEQGYSEEEIFQYLETDPKYSSKIKKAREEGYSNEEISDFLAKSPEKKEHSLYQKIVGRPADLIAEGIYSGFRSLPRTAFDITKTLASKIGVDTSTLEELQENAPQWLKDVGSGFFPTYEEAREGGIVPENAIEKGLEKAGRFAGESVLLGGIGGARGVAGIAGAATGAQIGEELDLNPYAQAGLTLLGGFGGAKATGKLTGLSKQKITPEVDSYMQASKNLGIDPLLTGMNPTQLQKVAQKWASHGIGGPEILKDAYVRRSGQVAKAFEEGMDKAGQNLFREPQIAGEALKESIQEATKQVEFNKSQLYKAVDKTLPATAKIKIKNPKKLEADLQKTISNLKDSLSLSPKESPVHARMQKLQNELEELLSYSDGKIPIRKLEATNRSLNEVIRYDRPGGADKLLIPFARKVRSELDRYGIKNPKYATARKAANDYFTDSVVHIRQNLLQSIARSERPESTLAIMNSVSGIRNVEKAIKSLPDGTKLFEGLRRYKLQSMLKDKIIDPTSGMMKVDGLKHFLNKKSDVYPVIKELAGPDSLRTLKLLQEAGKGLEKGFNNLVNPSRTADTLIALQSVIGPGKKIIGGIGKLAKANLGEGAIETVSGLGQALIPKALTKLILDPAFAEKVYAASKAAKNSDWRVFNRLIDTIDTELKKN